MKIKLLPLLVVFFAFSQVLEACPVYLIGKIIVVDENNKPIPSAGIWKYYGGIDSFKLRKYSYYDDIENPYDTNYFNIYTGGRRFIRETDDKAPDKMYLIKADGFADVELSSIFFDGDWSQDTVPVLVITMYAQKYVKRNSSITLLDKFMYKKVIEVYDTTRLTMVDYMGNEYDEAATQSTGKTFVTKVTTYPNPVVKGIHIKMNFNVTAPLSAKITDTQGKQVETLLIENNEVYWDWEWHKAGNYFLIVYDEKGNPIHTQLVAKL